MRWSVRALTAATWVPLWCGIASPEHADAVLARMLDPRAFWTPAPFPTVARSDAAFDPDGYWRGALWMDYALWAVEVLQRFGREIGLPLVRNRHGGDEHAFAIAQGDRVAFADRFGELGRYVERHRNRP